MAENERALSIAAALPNGPDRDAILRALKNSNKAIKEQSAARIEAEETASENKADAKKWRWLTWGAIGAGLIFLGLKLRPRL